MQPKINITVIITTYNWSEALEMVLMGLNHQTTDCFEVIIADDGSTSKTSGVINNYRLQVRYPLSHIWQEDTGFRASKIRNKAAAMAKGEYLIFLDGDCIPFMSFIQKHVELMENGWMVSGNRILLNAAFTKKVLENRISLYRFNIFQWAMLRLFGKCNRILPLLSLAHDSEFRKRKPQTWQGVKTCNLGIWKKDFLAVNGFDESFEGWGYEDSDLVVRLMNFGIQRKEGRCAIPVIHLWHQERQSSSENFTKLHQCLSQKIIISKLGIDQYT